jgi:hypothetical protein
MARRSDLPSFTAPRSADPVTLRIEVRDIESLAPIPRPPPPPPVPDPEAFVVATALIPARDRGRSRFVIGAIVLALVLAATAWLLGVLP